MTYREALAFLDRTQALGVKLGLSNIRTLLQELGAPHLATPSVLITGSNGKGSVASMMAASLTAAGLKVGVYTSPHLVRPEERIAIAGESISERMFADAATLVRDTITRLLDGHKLEHHPTYFECMTAMAFVAFASARLDIMVLEVGLGGRFDATNAAEPIVSAVTSIALEHTQYLGTTHAAIAFEKVAIARPGRPLVSGVRSAAAAKVIRDQARVIGAELLTASRRARIEIVSSTRAGLELTVATDRGAYPPIRLALRGRHQQRNAAVAITALEALPTPLRPTPDHIAAGLAQAHWPGRLEYVDGQPRILLDGAHNPHAARTLAAYLHEIESSTRRVLLFTCMRDKDLRGLVAPLWRLFESAVLTTVATERCMPAADIASRWPAQLPAVVEPNTDAALDKARSLAGSDGLIVVCGSLYLVGAIKALTSARTANLVAV